MKIPQDLLLDLIKKPELLWYDVLLFFLFIKGPVFIYHLGKEADGFEAKQGEI